jgi:hypothetical protein
MRQDNTDGQSVISMSGFMSATRFNAITEVESYWDAIRAGRLVPRRSDIDPRGIERALEFAFILERVAPGIARLRIAGSHLSDMMGMEVRGMPLSAFITPAGRETMSTVLEQVFDSPARATIDLHSDSAIGKPAIDARLVLLPMKSDLGDISRALGCFATYGDIGRAPRRFDITSHSATPLLGDFMPTAQAPLTQDRNPDTSGERRRTERPFPTIPQQIAAATGNVTRLCSGPCSYLSVVDISDD